MSTGQPTKCSSEYSGTTCSKAVDGNTGRSHPNEWHSLYDAAPYIRITLKGSTTNPTITLYARDCCNDQNMGGKVQIMIGKTDEQSTATICGELTDIADSSTKTTTCTGTGSYVWIHPHPDGPCTHINCAGGTKWALQIPEVVVIGNFGKYAYILVSMSTDVPVKTYL